MRDDKDRPYDEEWEASDEAAFEASLYEGEEAEWTEGLSGGTVPSEMSVWEVDTSAGSLSWDDERAYHQFEAGLRAYQQGDWDRVIQTLGPLVQQFPNYEREGHRAATLLERAYQHQHLRERASRVTAAQKGNKHKGVWIALFVGGLLICLLGLLLGAYGWSASSSGGVSDTSQALLFQDDFSSNSGGRWSEGREEFQNYRESLRLANGYYDIALTSYVSDRIILCVPVPVDMVDNFRMDATAQLIDAPLNGGVAMAFCYEGYQDDDYYVAGFMTSGSYGVFHYNHGSITPIIQWDADSETRLAEGGFYQFTLIRDGVSLTLSVDGHGHTLDQVQSGIDCSGGLGLGVILQEQGTVTVGYDILEIYHFWH